MDCHASMNLLDCHASMDLNFWYATFFILLLTMQVCKCGLPCEYEFVGLPCEYGPKFFDTRILNNGKPMRFFKTGITHAIFKSALCHASLEMNMLFL